MFLRFQPFFIVAETPLHPGSGNELGIVDLPIQRERHTGFPKIEGSGLKGAIREAFENSSRKVKINFKEVELNDRSLISIAFGPEDGGSYAGSLAFTDAKILLFPVKSLKGIFAWITCPQVIARFREDLTIAGVNLLGGDFPSCVKGNTLPDDSNISIDSKVVLEEFTFKVEENQSANKLAYWFASRVFPEMNSNDLYRYWREKLQRDLVILPDNDFKEFVTTSTEVIARTIIDNKTGTAKNLWYEEYLPQDTVLYSIAMASPIRTKNSGERDSIFRGKDSYEEASNVIQFFSNVVLEFLQIGGNQTIGKGVVRIQVFK